METKILGAAMAARGTYDLVNEHLSDKDFSKEYQLIKSMIKGYYERDSSADKVDTDIILSLIESTVPNKKHQERLSAYVSEAVGESSSVANVDHMILEGKLSALGQKIALALVNKTNPDELIAEYSKLKEVKSLAELGSKGTEFLTHENFVEVMTARQDGGDLLRLYPLAINNYLKGGVGPGHHVVLFARPEMGKCLALGTEVLMANGEVKKVEDVVNGDMVAGPTGARLVSGTTTGTAMMYRVSYPWGESYEVNDEHILSLKRSKQEGGHKYGDILNVPVKEYVAWSDSKKARYKGWKCGVDYPTSDVVMPPYLLGLWLGDGTTAKPSITTVDEEILTAFVDRYGQPSYVEQGITYTFGRTALHTELKDVGVLGDKHIPTQYLISDREQRLELLAGIIDSDGHLCGGNKGYEIVTNKEILKDGYVRLARSLGFHATSNRVFKRATNSNHAGDWYWRVYIGAEAIGEVPVRVARKVGTRHASPKRKGLQFGIKVEAIGEGSYAGFCVDGDHLFMLADYTVTHNTAFNATVACGFANQGAFGIYFINEDRTEDVYIRLVCCLVGQPEEVVVADYERWQQVALQRGLANIMLVSLAPGTLGEIEKFVEQYQPRWVIVDQLRNLSMKETNKVLQLEYAASGMRNIAKKHNLVAVSTTQAGDSAEGKRLLTMGDIDYSNTGIPAQADVLIGVGATPEDVALGMRYASICKNKRGGGHAQVPLRIHSPISRYTDHNGN